MKKRSIPVVAFMDLLGTRYYAETDPDRYRENLLAFKAALTSSRTSILKGIGNVYLFSDCAYFMCLNPTKLLAYLDAVRAYLLPRHLYVQAAMEKGELRPEDAGTTGQGVVLGTIFGPDVATVYARQNSLKGAAIRVSETLINEKYIPKTACVKSCHLPNPTNSSAECFWDIRYRPSDVSREQLKIILEDCLRAKSVRLSAGAYYVSVLISMIRSVDWRRVDLDVPATENNTAARHIYDLLLRGEFNRHFGDLRGAEYVFFAMLDEVYNKCEHRAICEKICHYIAARPRLMRRIGAVPPDLLSHQNRHKFLESTLQWSKLPETPKAPQRRKKAHAG